MVVMDDTINKANKTQVAWRLKCYLSCYYIVAAISSHFDDC